jgi:hypothetical protein
VGANSRSGPVVSDSSEYRKVFCLMVSDWSGGVSLVCGMKRGISTEVIRIDFSVRDSKPWHLTNAIGAWRYRNQLHLRNRYDT